MKWLPIRAALEAIVRVRDTFCEKTCFYCEDKLCSRPQIFLPEDRRRPSRKAFHRIKFLIFVRREHERGREPYKSETLARPGKKKKGREGPAPGTMPTAAMTRSPAGLPVSDHSEIADVRHPPGRLSLEGFDTPSVLLARHAAEIRSRSHPVTLRW